jgi:hypothetical protein
MDDFLGIEAWFGRSDKGRRTYRSDIVKRGQSGRWDRDATRKQISHQSDLELEFGSCDRMWTTWRAMDWPAAV